MDIVAHRGASHDAPENTLAAFRLAWQQQADVVELDIRLTADGRIVCIHDATALRTTGVDREVAKTALSELQQLDAGRLKNARFAGERIPTLQAALATVPNGKRVFIEVKTGPEVLPSLAACVQNASLGAQQYAIISFNEAVVDEAKRALPGTKAFLLYSFKKTDGRWSSTPRELLARAKRLGADGLDVGYGRESSEIVDRPFAEQFKAAGKELHVWTVDDADLARRAAGIGVNSITTNRPGWLRTQLGLH
jgi:glycerophosphoryl diester phosphodiesterase